MSENEKRGSDGAREPSAARQPGDGSRDVRNLIRDDIIGVSDWKSSKIGYLTGFSAAKRAVSNIGSAFGDAKSRTFGLLGDLTRREQVPGLAEGGDAASRFAASMKLHRRTERDLQHIVLNSYRSAWLYLWLIAAGLAVAAWTVIYWPPGSLLALVARLGPLPLAVALFLKHSYTNWMVRRRRLDGINVFLASGQFLPKRTA